MQLSIIIPYTKGDSLREEALVKLFDCIKIQNKDYYELIVIEDLMGKQNPEFPFINAVNKFITISDPQQRKYNKSWNINVATREATNETCCIIDADSMFGKDYFERLYYFAETHPIFFHGYKWIVLMPGRDNPIVRISSHSKIASTGGVWGFNRDWFFNKLGACNENYFGYGCEDGDLWIRASYLLNDIPELDYPLVHQYHHWHQKDGANPLNEKRSDIINYTKLHTNEVINKLISANLGQKAQPTLI